MDEEMMTPGPPLVLKAGGCGDLPTMTVLIEEKATVAALEIPLDGGILHVTGSSRLNPDEYERFDPQIGIALAVGRALEEASKHYLSFAQARIEHAEMQRQEVRKVRDNLRRQLAALNREGPPPGATSESEAAEDQEAQA